MAVMIDMPMVMVMVVMIPHLEATVHTMHPKAQMVAA
jgi:hypothetical protein